MATCAGGCTISGSEFICQAQTLCINGPVNAQIVLFNGNHDLVAWGSCMAPASGDFCCAFDEPTANVDTVTLKGTDFADEALKFSINTGTGNEKNLEPWDSDPIHGYARGLNGNDYIYGSNIFDSDYNEDLLGHANNDHIYGNGGEDFISGGNGNDE